MAIFLRNTRTGFYYAGYNRWRVDADTAFDFETTQRAARWADTIRLPEVEIVRLEKAKTGQLPPQSRVYLE